MMDVLVATSSGLEGGSAARNRLRRAMATARWALPATDEAIRAVVIGPG